MIKSSSTQKIIKDESGVALIEAVMLIPIMVSLVFGLYDLGHGILINKKTVSAAHIAGDLIARKNVVSDADLAEAIEAAKLAIDPYDRGYFGIDIASITFQDEDTPSILWRETQNMQPNPDIPSDAIGLGFEGEGVLAVSVTYQYTPLFYKMFFERIEMKEVSFLRGRKTSVIRHEDQL